MSLDWLGHGNMPQIIDISPKCVCSQKGALAHTPGALKSKESISVSTSTARAVNCAGASHRQVGAKPVSRSCALGRSFLFLSRCSNQLAVAMRVSTSNGNRAENAYFVACLDVSRGSLPGSPPPLQKPRYPRPADINDQAPLARRPFMNMC